jgi:hypothetical protein
MKSFLLRYKFAIILCIALIVTVFAKPEMGNKMVDNLRLNII